MSTEISIPKDIYLQMLSHLQETYPEEGCGLLGGHAQHISHIYPIENILHSPSRYEMSPKEQIEAFIEVEEAGMHILATYHSHPNGPDIPSETDIEEAAYPELIYLIVSLKELNQPTIRGFFIQNSQATEVAVEVV